jgi:hypothetical protein
MECAGMHATGKKACKWQKCMQEAGMHAGGGMHASGRNAGCQECMQEEGKLASDMHVVGIGGRNARMQLAGMAFGMREADMEIVGMIVSQAPKMSKEQNLKKGK